MATKNEPAVAAPALTVPGRGSASPLKVRPASVDRNRAFPVVAMSVLFVANDGDSTNQGAPTASREIGAPHAEASHAETVEVCDPAEPGVTDPTNTFPSGVKANCFPTPGGSKA